ncbi:MAG TPA: DNA ligase D, partial [Gemmatimonadaceae bacterium]|nr:DNA ligase D [Gemmatimonadaceae bacterium]
DEIAAGKAKKSTARRRSPKRPAKKKSRSRKDDDGPLAQAKPSRAPSHPQPQLAMLVSEAPEGDGWLHEMKFDGYRMFALIDDGEVRFRSRNDQDWTPRLLSLTKPLAGLAAKNCTLDGEVVVLDERGISSFQMLQQLGSSRRGLAFFAFDLLELDGESLEPLPLVERKARLKELVGARAGIIRYTAHSDDSGDEVFAKACALGAEGIISKLRDAPYRSGARSADWQKIKCVKRQEFVIGGFTDPEGSRVGVGSMLIGYYERAALRFAGKVGTGRGWSDAFGRKLRKQLEAIEIDASPFDPPPRGWLGKNAHWVKPKLVAEIEFTEWTGDGNVRHPSLQGFRTDKKPRDVVRERAVEAALAQRTAAARPVYPRIGFDSDKLAALYEDIAEWALPHVENRPLTLVRMSAPVTRDDALRSQAMFVHHTTRDQAFVGNAVPRRSIRELKKIGEYRYVDSRDALLALVAAGVIEWHVWNARVDAVETPDRVVFDIDPGDGVPWARVVEAARRLRRRLRALDLESWVKTTGGKGLHVVVPFKAEHSWDDVFEFSRSVAADLSSRQPDRYTIEFDRSKRRGKVLIDYKRNHRTSIAVAGFSTRARPNGAMSVPVRWEELGRLGAGDVFTVENIRTRLSRLRADPWKDYWSSRQRLVVPKGLEIDARRTEV